jgi:nucleotide-binding universal stress UspA family protein
VLHAVRVLEWPIGFTSASTSPTAPTLRVPDPELDESYRHGMRRIFDEVAPLPDWDLSFAEGPTAATLVQLARHADLLVLGSRERAVLGDARVGNIGH